MTAIVIYKNTEGKLQGLGPAAERRYVMFKKWVASLDHGDTAGFQAFIPRSPKHHRMFFRKIQLLLERSETFPDVPEIRDWLTLSAGYMVKEEGAWVVQSIDFESMDEADFSEYHRKVNDFLWTERAQKMLWPHLQPHLRNEQVKSFFEEVDRRGEQQL